MPAAVAAAAAARGVNRRRRRRKIISDPTLEKSLCVKRYRACAAAILRCRRVSLFFLLSNIQYLLGDGEMYPNLGSRSLGHIGRHVNSLRTCLVRF